MDKGIFITGADTEVGKTIVTAGLAGAIKSKGLNTGIMKPVATGSMRDKNGQLISDDVRFLIKSIDCEEKPSIVNPISLELPLSPLVASRIENKEINIKKIKEAYSHLSEKYDFVVVEGIGGLLVPIKENYFVTDMIIDLGLSVVIVSRPGLGTINHTLLTINEARRRGIDIKGFIINWLEDQNPGTAERTNPGIISELSDIPLLGILPHDPLVDVAALNIGNLIELTLEHIDIDCIL